LENTALGLALVMNTYAGSMLIARTILCAQAERDYKKLKEMADYYQSPELNAKLETLERFVKKNKHNLKEEATRYGLEMGKVLPITLSGILHKVSTISAYIPKGLGSIGSLFSVISSGVQLKKSVKGKRMHQAWTKEIEKRELERISHQAENLKNKRVEIRQNRLQFNQQAVRKLIDDLGNQGGSWEQIVEQLKKNGIYLERAEILINSKLQGLSQDLIPDFKVKSSIQSAEALQEYFKDNQKFQNNLVEQYTDHQDAIAVSTRQALQTLSKEKVAQNKKFFNFKVFENSTFFSITTLSAVTTFVLEVLTLAGLVALPMLAMAIPGAGPVIAGVALMAIGLLFLRKYKPNIFKTITQFTQARLAMLSIPLAIQEMRLRVRKLKLEHNKAALYLISAPLTEMEGFLKGQSAIDEQHLPNQLKPLLHKLKQSTIKKLEAHASNPSTLEDAVKAELEKLRLQNEKLVTEIYEIEDKVIHWKETANRLKSKIEVANLKDFVETAHLASGKLENVDIWDVIAEGIIKGKFVFDLNRDATGKSDLEEILQSEMGINLSKIADDLYNEKKQKADLAEALKNFFKMDHSQMLQFIRERLGHE
jgi:hypothetical protein